MKNNISRNKHYLDEIVEKLLAGHAAVVVGAGFSKNAVPKHNSTSRKFPDWSELGDVFYEKVYKSNKKQGKEREKEKKYLNILKLAGEVEAVFGRSVLDDMLKENIPNMEYEPSDLHKKLLNLPWSDVFTTNYDTLLERASDDVFNKKFSIIDSTDKLVCASKPRIIKLHGSFPSQKPFIITEEDYRLYPQNKAPFINTVQQALIENIVCLIGFSGDDPNFLAWIGWLRDNINTKLSKIYLICPSKQPIPQKKLLKKRNIITINMNNNDPSEALNSFLSYLSEEIKSKDIKLWPRKQKHQAPEMLPNQAITNSDIVKIIDYWKEQRESYPGWEILLVDKRTGFWRNTVKYLNILNIIEDFDVNLQIHFLYELVWRLDKSLIPVGENIGALIERVILDKNIDTQIKIDLEFALLRHFRQRGEDDKWRAVYQNIKNSSNLTLDLESELEYEKGLHCLFGLYFPELKETVESWKYPSDTPFQNAKKAGILAETGQLDLALKILEESLVNIRNQKSSTLKLLSQEDFILHIYYFVKFISRNDFKNDPYNKDERTERIFYLKSRLCDSYKEMEYFMHVFSQDCATSFVNQKYDFDLNLSSQSKQFNPIGLESAYSFFVFCEKIALPFNFLTLLFSSELIAVASKSIHHNNYFWAFSVTCRSFNIDIVNAMFDRHSLLEMTSNYSNDLCRRLIKILLDNKEFLSLDKSVNNLADTLASVVPDIISRLCTKCNTATKHKIIGLIADILSSSNQQKYAKIIKLLERFISSLSEKEVSEFLPKILKLNIPDSSILHHPDKISSPLCKLNKSSKIDVKVDGKLLEQYFNGAKSAIPKIRKWSISTLIELFKLNLLNEDAKKLFAEALWFNCGQDNLPENADIFKSDFLYLPSPPNINPLNLVSEYLKNMSEYIEHYSGDFLGIYVKATHYYNELDSMPSDKKEYFDIEQHIQVLINFWSKFKYLLAPDNEFKLHFVDTIHSIIETIANIAQKSELSKETIGQIKEFITSLNECGVVAIQLRSSFIKEIKSDIIDEIVENISNKERFARRDALKSIIILMKKFSSKDTKSLINDLIYSIRFEESNLLADNIWALAILIKQNNNIYFDEEKLILSAVKHAAEISEYNTDSMLCTEEKIIIRQQAMFLASVIFHLYSDKDKVPAEILHFFEIYQDENEFADVRNMWERYELEIQ